MIALLCAAACASASPEQQGKGADVQTDGKDGQDKADTPPAVIPFLPACDVSKDKTQDAKSQEDIQRYSASCTWRLAKDTKRVADYTFVLIGIGFLVGLGEIYIMKRQSKHAGVAAEAAARGLYLSARPYLGVTHIRLEGLIHGQEMRATIHLRNWKGNPANNARFVIAHRIPGDPELPDEAVYLPANLWRRVNGAVVAESSPRKLELQFGYCVTNRVFVEGAKFYVYGCVMYPDGFDNWLETRFIRQITIENGMAKYSIPNKPSYSYQT